MGDNFSKIRIFNIKEYELQVFANGQWDTFYKGDLIGACKIIQLPVALQAEKLKLKIFQSSGKPSICHIAVANQQNK